MTFLERVARKVLRRPAQVLLLPVHRRIDQVNDLAGQVNRHLPIVENVIESQNAELRSRVRAEAEMRAELEQLRSDLSLVRRQLVELRQEVGVRALAGPQVEPVAGRAGK